MQDKNYKSFAGENGILINSWENPTNPSTYSDVMKFSNCTNVVVSGVEIHGGKEDCIDAVRGANYQFSDLTLVPLANGVTLKGSIDGCILKDIKITKAGKDYTIEIGQYDNYWYFGRKPTRNIKINNVSMVDGSPVNVRLWDAETPTITSSNVKLTKVPKIIWIWYFIVRAIQTRGIKNLFKPVDNNSFIKTK